MIDAMARVARREIRDARMASAGWGTVTSSSPLAVALDEGSGAPMTATPTPLTSGLTVGDRVWVEIAGNRAVIVGRAGGQASVPPGSVTAFAGASAPGGWLLCGGQAVSRTTYAELFAAIGATYGAGNGSTTFNVPNLAGRVPVGLDAGQTEFNTLGKTGGAKTHTLTTAQIPDHRHLLDQDGGNVGYATGSTNLRFSVGWANTRDSSNISTGWTGGGEAHPNLQPYIVLNYIIKT